MQSADIVQGLSPGLLAVFVAFLGEGEQIIKDSDDAVFASLSSPLSVF